MKSMKPVGKESDQSFQIPSESAEEIALHGTIVRSLEPAVHDLTRAQIAAQLTSAIRRRRWWAEDAIRADLRALDQQRSNVDSLAAGFAFAALYSFTSRWQAARYWTRKRRGSSGPRHGAILITAMAMMPAMRAGV